MGTQNLKTSSTSLTKKMKTQNQFKLERNSQESQKKRKMTSMAWMKLISTN